MNGARLNLERLARNRAFTLTPNRIRDLQQRFDEVRHENVAGDPAIAAGSPASGADGWLRGLRKVDLRRFIVHKKEILTRNRMGLDFRDQSAVAAQALSF